MGSLLEDRLFRRDIKEARVLEKALRQTFDDRDVARNLAQSAGLDRDRLDMSGSPSAFWSRILDNAADERRLTNLLEVVEERPRNPTLEDAIADARLLIDIPPAPHVLSPRRILHSLSAAAQIGFALTVVGVGGLVLAGAVVESARAAMGIASFATSVLGLAVAFASWLGRRFGFDARTCSLDGAMTGIAASIAGAVASIESTASIESGIRLALVCLVAMIPTGALWAVLIETPLGNRRHPENARLYVLVLVLVSTAWGGLVAVGAPTAPQVGSGRITMTILASMIVMYLLTITIIVWLHRRRALGAMHLPVQLVLEVAAGIGLYAALGWRIQRFTFYADSVGRAAFAGLLTTFLLVGTLVLLSTYGVTRLIVHRLPPGRD